jgi:thioredoxin 1
MMNSDILELTSHTWEAAVAQEGILVLDFWAGWCGACQEFAPVFAAVARRYPNHRFGKINTETETQLLELLGIEHIPTLVLFRDGLMLFRQPGNFSEAKLMDIVRQAESVDMNQVRAHLRTAAGDASDPAVQLSERNLDQKKT